MCVLALKQNKWNHVYKKSKTKQLLNKIQPDLNKLAKYLK